MSDLLSIGASGIHAYQRALATVSNNIANVNTDGYSRQDNSVAASQPRRVGNSYIGTGAFFDGVRRQYDAFIEANLRNSNSELRGQEPLLTYVNRLIDVMADESIGLTSALNRFFQSARDLASDPAALVPRNIFLRDAEGLAARFRQLSQQLELLDNETRQAVETDIGQVNALTQQLAQVNKQLSRHASADKQPPELLDQRDLLLRKLSTFTAIKTSFAPNGEVRVSVGDLVTQGVLVDGHEARSIGVFVDPSEPSALRLLIDPFGRAESVPNLGAGKVAGLLTFRDRVLAPANAALANLAEVVVREVNAAHRNGLDLSGALGGDLFAIDPQARDAAAGMRLAIQEATRVAAAGQFRVIDDPLNVGNAHATVAFALPDFKGPVGLTGDLATAQVPAIGYATLPIDASRPFAAVGVLPLGSRDATLALLDPQPGQVLQVLTRDGRHLLGQPLTPEQQALLMRSELGMEAGARYSAESLGQPYLGMDLFLGAQAEVRPLQRFSATGEALAPQLAPALLRGVRPPDWPVTVADGALTLNGGPLPAATLNNLTELQAWLGAAGLDVEEEGGALLIGWADGNTERGIRLGMGPNGSPQDLARLGFDTTATLRGAAQDDLLVFVTSPSASQARVAAQFGSLGGDLQQALRERRLEVRFTADNAYQITDQATGTLLAERAFDPRDPNAVVAFRGLAVSFSTAPRQGDRFVIDGNADGIGNNQAMLALVALENQRLMPGTLTLTEAYIERVNQVGNVARQATISQQALTVVYEQARQARAMAAGVSLDEEAANLVRFQQAYQANAKVMQTAGLLFDAILQVR
jgi:flagellar hook-associated protein 1